MTRLRTLTTAPEGSLVLRRWIHRWQCDGTPSTNDWRGAAAPWTSPEGTTTWSCGMKIALAPRLIGGHRAAYCLPTARRHRGKPLGCSEGHRNDPTSRTRGKDPALRSQTAPTHRRTKHSENSDFLTPRTHQRLVVLVKYCITITITLFIECRRLNEVAWCLHRSKLQVSAHVLLGKMTFAERFRIKMSSLHVRSSSMLSSDFYSFSSCAKCNEFAPKIKRV